MTRTSRRFTAFITVALTCLSPLPALAGQGAAVVKDFTYTTTEEGADPKGFAEERIEEDGTWYVLESVSEPVLVGREEAERKTVTITSGASGEEGGGDGPDEAYTDGDGVLYGLVSQELIETVSEERTEYREETVTYEAVEAGVIVPRSITYTLTDAGTGETAESELQLVSETVMARYWSDDFEIPLTITGYGADTIEFGSFTISAGDNILDHAGEILEYLALDPDSYVINDIAWAGEEYEEDGEARRDLTATGSKLVSDVEAVYGGEAAVPASSSYAWECVYEETLPEDERYVYTYRAMASYAREGEPEETVGSIRIIPGKMAEIVKEHPAAATGTVTVAAAAFMALLITRKRKKKKAGGTET